MYAGIESERLADKICNRLETSLYHRQLEDGELIEGEEDYCE